MKKDKNFAGIIALLFGWLGAHRFYLGQTKRAFLYLAMGLVGMRSGFLMGVVALISFLDALLFFSMDSRRFNEKYSGQPKGGGADFERQAGRHDTDFERQAAKPRPGPPPRFHKVEPLATTDPRQNPHLNAGLQKFKDFDYKGAIVDFEKSLQLSPADVATHFNLACAYSLTEEVKRAFNHLELAVAHGFRDFQKIQGHHALAFLRIQPAFDVFKENGYRMPRDTKAPSGKQGDLLGTSPDLLDQLNKLADLKNKGFLTESEFVKSKEAILQNNR